MSLTRSAARCVSTPRNRSNTSTQFERDRKSTRLNSSHTVIYTLSLHDALPIFLELVEPRAEDVVDEVGGALRIDPKKSLEHKHTVRERSEEHTSELQSHSDLHSFPTRRSSDLSRTGRAES